MVPVLSSVRRRVRGWTSTLRPARSSAAVAAADLAVTSTDRAFSHGTRPVIRWDLSAGDGSDEVTRAAIGAATRQHGSEVDYCLCTVGLEAARVREVLAWATQPVEWWPLAPGDLPRAVAPVRPGAAERVLAPPPSTVSVDRTGEPSVVERFAWLGNAGQWGVPGWSLNDDCTRFILDVAAAHAGDDVLELGTSRGRIAAMLATLGCRVTTVDHVDRGAAQNLEGLDVTVVLADAEEFLRAAQQRFALVVVDLHGNDEATWRRLFPVLAPVVADGGQVVIVNLTLARIPEWRTETGVAWLVEHLPAGFEVESRLDELPGVVVLRRA